MKNPETILKQLRQHFNFLNNVNITVEIGDKDGGSAMTSNREVHISLDSRFLDEMSAATVISHEIGHVLCYWAETISEVELDSENEKAIANGYKFIEHMADLFGCFIMHRAGMDAQSYMVQTFTSTFKDMGLRYHDSDTHPSVVDRVAAIKYFSKELDWEYIRSCSDAQLIHAAANIWGELLKTGTKNFPKRFWKFKESIRQQLREEDRKDHVVRF